jgi:hypothetical protein
MICCLFYDPKIAISQAKPAILLPIRATNCR